MYLVTTPLDPHIMLSKDLSPESEEERTQMKKIPYLTMVGSIMYAATATCPDVTFAIQHLSQFNCNLGNAHWTTAQHIIQYLYATRTQSLVFGGLDINLTAWVDSDWGACTDMCHSKSYIHSALDLALSHGVPSGVPRTINGCHIQH